MNPWHRSISSATALSLLVTFAACSSEDAGGTGGAEGSAKASPDGGNNDDNTSKDSGGSGADAGHTETTGCKGLTIEPATDYGADGPYGTVTITGTGPDGQYTLVRPDSFDGGTKHPIATWGNGISTMPEHYDGLLSAIASHGFVIIASNSTTVNATLMTQGLDWLIEQNDAAGDLQGKLETECAVTIGYSLGGGASVDAASHPNIRATVSWHGLQGVAEAANGPILLLTSTNDGFVTKSDYVQPCYDRSSVQPTVMGTLEVPGAPPDFAGHLIPLGDARDERAPGIAWLRYWIYGDEGAREWFFGDDCALCTSPWTDIQRKNHEF